jgi:hypothetical protein
VMELDESIKEKDYRNCGANIDLCRTMKWELGLRAGVGGNI